MSDDAEPRNNTDPVVPQPEIEQIEAALGQESGAAAADTPAAAPYEPTAATVQRASARTAPVQRLSVRGEETMSEPTILSDGGADYDGADGSGGDYDQASARPTWLKPLLVAFAILVVALGAYIFAAWSFADRVPKGVEVGGVNLGGLESAEAVATLERQFGPDSGFQVRVAVDTDPLALDAAAAGLSLDASQTVNSVVGFSLQPAHIWAHLFGGISVEPVTAVDEAALRAALESLIAPYTIAPIDGTVEFRADQVFSTEAVVGRAVDLDQAQTAVAVAWLDAGLPIELPTADVLPEISQEDVEQAVTEIAEPAVSGPVWIRIGDRSAELVPRLIGQNATLVPVNGQLELQVDGAALEPEIHSRVPDLLTDPVDARFEFVDGVPEIQPGTPGTAIDPEVLAQTVLAALDSPQRDAQLALTEQQPAVTTAELEAYGVAEIVSEFSTPLTSEPRRTQNIRNAASILNGYLVEPGAEFSLTEALGEITAERGFVAAGVIVRGKHTDSMGGGLSQISTTTYNIGHFAGYEDLEHRPHSEYISRYPEGRESTIWTGEIDMRFRNNTPYGGLIQAWIEGGRLWMRIWSTEHWEVNSTTSPRSNIQAATTTYDTSADCVAQGGGQSGFYVSVHRTVSKDGVIEIDETNGWAYRPVNRVVCGPDPATVTPDSDPDAED